MTAALAPVPTRQLPDGFVQLTEVVGEFEERERVVWLNPTGISHFSEFRPWRRTEVRPKWTSISMLNGSCLRVTESPERVAELLES